MIYDTSYVNGEVVQTVDFFECDATARNRLVKACKERNIACVLGLESQFLEKVEVHAGYPSVLTLIAEPPSPNIQ